MCYKKKEEIKDIEDKKEYDLTIIKLRLLKTFIFIIIAIIIYLLIL